MRRALALAAIVLASPSAAMDFCAGPVRTTCVVDGDTVWIEGEKIRIADIDAPESGGACEAERVTAARASGRLAELLDRPYLIERAGKDRYGRTLATIMVDGRSASSRWRCNYFPLAILLKISRINS